MKVPAPSLTPILRSDTQGRILARLLADASKTYNLSELVEWAGSSMPTVQREIRRAEEAGIVTTKKVGPTRLVRANPDHPLFGALSQVVLATYGPPVIIAREFQDVEGAEAVLLFGSWAARYLGQPGRAPNDIDVLVIGSPDRDEVDDAAERAERTIGLPVQATVRARSQWSAERDSFIHEVKGRPLVVVLADDDIAEELQGGGLSGSQGDERPTAEEDGPPMSSHPKLEGIARAVIDANKYVTLATADGAGRPWASPVYYTPDGYDVFYWASSPDAVHSGNLAQRPELSMVIFDSQAQIGGAEAVYMVARAEVVPDDELERCAELYGSRFPELRVFRPDGLRAPAALRLYRARVAEHSVLVRGSDPEFGRGVDTRMAITL